MQSRDIHWVSISVYISLWLFPSLLLPPPALAQKAQNAEAAAVQHFNAAHKAQEAGDLDTAAREYVAVVRLLPDAAEAYASLGLVYNAQGNYAASAHALGKAEKLKPGLPGVSLYLGIDYEQQRQAAAALPRLVEAVRLDAASKDANTWLGRALWDQGRTQEALAQLRKSSMLYPADPALLLESGEAYHKAAELGIARVLEESSGTPLQHQVYGDIYKDERAWENAMAHYYRALEMDPHWHGAHFGLGDVALRRNKLETAAEEYRHELEANPGSAESLARLGELALLQGRPEEALNSMSQAIALSGYAAAHTLGLPRAYPPTSEDFTESEQSQLQANLPALQAAPATAARDLLLAFAQMRLGHNDAFAASWKVFTEKIPRVPFANPYERGLGDFYRQDFASAAASLDAWRRTHPNDLRARYLLATTYRNLSLNTLDQLLTVAPDSSPAHELLAETYQNAEQDAKALKEYRVVASMEPDFPGVHFSIGHLLAKTGQAEAARSEFATELRLNPDHAEANAEMGTILLNQQETVNAVPYLEKALKADPDLWSAYSQLGKAYYAEKDYTKAETALRQAVRHDPQGLAHYQLALVYRSIGKKDAADAQFAISRKLKLDALTHDETKMNTLTDVSQ